MRHSCLQQRWRGGGLLLLRPLWPKGTGAQSLPVTCIFRVFHAASHLLTTREEPQRISKALGWPTTAEFSKQFEAVFEIPPTVYREKFGSPAEKAEDIGD